MAESATATDGREKPVRATREIIEIDEEKCTGCGLCIPNCPEGAIQLIDQKARIVSDLYCDGLGACIGHCPEDAIAIVERPAEPYDERRVMENVIEAGPNVIRAHLDHLKEHGQTEYYEEALTVLEEEGIAVPEKESEAAAPLPCGCPGTLDTELEASRTPNQSDEAERELQGQGAISTSHLQNWPVQLRLINPNAPSFKGASVALVADCVAYAYARTHDEFLNGKKTIVACPKLDDTTTYAQKLAHLIADAKITDITWVRMEVPCCRGFLPLLQRAMTVAGQKIPIEEIVVSIDGDRIGQTTHQ